MNLSKKQLEVSDFIVSLINKSIVFNKPTLKKLLALYSNVDNKFIDDKEGDKPITIFLSNYEFKNYNDFVSILEMLKEQKYFDEGITFYTHSNEVIIDKLFNSSFIDTRWIIDHMSINGSFAEINYVIGYVFNHLHGSEIKFLKQLIEYVDGMRKSIIVYEAIIRFGISKKIDGLHEIFQLIFDKDPKIETLSLQNSFDNIADERIKNIVGVYLYKKTKNSIFLPVAAQEIFIF